jgi:hypothetical protein
VHNAERQRTGLDESVMEDNEGSDRDICALKVVVVWQWRRWLCLLAQAGGDCLVYGLPGKFRDKHLSTNRSKVQRGQCQRRAGRRASDCVVGDVHWWWWRCGGGSVVTVS